MHAIDFLNLFSIHILPDSLVRIRHYGLLSPRNRDKLRKVQIQMGGTPVPKERKTKSYMEICIEGYRFVPELRYPDGGKGSHSADPRSAYLAE